MEKTPTTASIIAGICAVVGLLSTATHSPITPAIKSVASASVVGGKNTHNGNKETKEEFFHCEG